MTHKRHRSQSSSNSKTGTSDANALDASSSSTGYPATMQARRPMEEEHHPSPQGYNDIHPIDITSAEPRVHHLEREESHYMYHDTTYPRRHHGSRSRHSSTTTVTTTASSDGHETSHTIIVPSPVQQESSDEKDWLPKQNEKQANESIGDAEALTTGPKNFVAGYDSHGGGSLKTHPLAWIALFFLVVLRSAVSIFQNTFSPIPKTVAHYLSVDLSAVNWMFNIQAVVYIGLSFFTGWIFERFGTKKSVSYPTFDRVPSCRHVLMELGLFSFSLFLLVLSPPSDAGFAGLLS